MIKTCSETNNVPRPPPPNPSDRKLRQAIFALEVLALDESQPDELSRDALLLQNWLCNEHHDDNDKDWTWVVEHLAPSDKHATYVLKTAMDVTPEPDENDINVLLWFRLVKLEIDDCWNDHHADGATVDVALVRGTGVEGTGKVPWGAGDSYARPVGGRGQLAGGTIDLFSGDLFAAFDLFGPLPSPKVATPEFLVRIGLEPAPFQEWLRGNSDDDDAATGSEWPGIVLEYVRHHSAFKSKLHVREDGEEAEIHELQYYGITEQMAEAILKNAGGNYRLLLPQQYIETWVVDRLVEEVRRLKRTPKLGL